MKTAIIFILVMLLVILMPFATVWMLNTLFHLELAFTFKTWLAAMILNMLCTTNVKTSQQFS